MKDLFEVMSNIIEEDVEYYKSDFNYDKETIIKNGENQSYIWYTRQSGTELFNMQYIDKLDTADNIEARFWLSQAISIYQIDVISINDNKPFGNIKKLSKYNIEQILKNSRGMSFIEKLNYITKDLKELNSIDFIYVFNRRCEDYELPLKFTSKEAIIDYCKGFNISL